MWYQILPHFCQMKFELKKRDEDELITELSVYDIVPGSAPGCRTGNGEKLSITHAEPVQAI